MTGQAREKTWEQLQCADLEAQTAQVVIRRMRRAGLDPDHVIASTVHEAGYVDDRDDQLHAWPASMTRAEIGDLVQLEGARRYWEANS